MSETVSRRNRPSPAAPTRVAVATVLENREPYRIDTLTLFRSLRLFGGRVRAARCFAFFVEEADPTISKGLADLGAVVDVVERAHARCSNANKIQMLRDYDDCNYLVALDNDIVVARDFSSYLKCEAIGCRPVNVEPRHAKSPLCSGDVQVALRRMLWPPMPLM